ncbi:MAG TPA: glycosyltransferase family A protein [Sphingomicrobium sp.]|nr:glycosyltransferase family A protein [Sphingomicrobium sp.]
MATATVTGPLVSVLVPAHDAQSTLSESLRSALAGTYPNIELLVVDDGSRDSTARIAEDFAAADNRIQVHRQSQQGVSAALNLALRHARGDYVARLDSDDLWHPTKLERQMQIAARDPEAALIHAFVRYIDGQGRIVRDVAPQHFPRRALSRCLYDGIIGGNSSVLFRRSAIERAGGFDEQLASWEDLLFQLAVLADNPAAVVPEYLVGYRVRPDSLSADPQNMLDSWRVARRRIDERFPQIPKFVRDWAHGRRLVQLAESFAWKGRYATCTRLLAEGAAFDPRYARAFLGYRMARKLGPRRDETGGDAPHFLECDPEETYRFSAFDCGLEGAGLNRLEEGRRRLLEQIDGELIAR